jgi:phospholipid N-methyltransferase
MAAALAKAAAICQRQCFSFTTSGYPSMTSSAERVQENKFVRAVAAHPLWQFLRGFLKHPVMVGSIIPSSDKLIDKMLAPVDWANTKLFVEYGPGVGTFTQPILDRLAPDATLLAIDTNPDFVAYLNGKVRDNRLIAVNGSAAEVRDIIAGCGKSEADYVLSGLPFSTLPPGVGARIAEETAAALRPGGAFLVYQFSPKVREFIAPHFQRIDRGFEWINVPPATLFWAWKD